MDIDAEIIKVRNMGEKRAEVRLRRKVINFWLCLEFEVTETSDEDVQ